jgi:hypothetical protein
VTQSKIVTGGTVSSPCENNFPPATLIISTLRIFKEQLATQSRKPNASSALSSVAGIWFGTLRLIDQAIRLLVK